MLQEVNDSENSLEDATEKDLRKLIMLNMKDLAELKNIFTVDKEKMTKDLKEKYEILNS